MLFQNLYVPLSINRAFTDVTVGHDAIGTNTPPYHHRHWLLKLALVTVQMVLFLFSPEALTSMCSENSFKCGLVRPQHTFLLYVSPSQIATENE